MSVARAAAAAAPAPLLSAQWFRVASLRPCLDEHATVRRQAVRGEVWQVLARADGSRSFRLDALAWSVVGLCDGRRTLQRIWDAAMVRWQDDAPTQDDVMDLMARLHREGLVSFDREPDFGGAVDGAGGEAAARAPEPGHAGGARLSLGRPDRLMAALARLTAPMASPAGRLAGAALVLAGAAVAWLQAPELSAWVAAAALSPAMLAQALAVQLAMKLLHETAHGVALRRAGAPVGSWGLAWPMGLPMPYVDASAAAQLPDRRARARVAAAGIVAELRVAALALLAAQALQPGAWRDAVLLVFATGTLSALLVNANPLLRFDGYHLLTDLLDLPNLASRSARLWLDGLRSRLLRLPGEPSLRPAPGERIWLRLHAPLALAMRVAVAVGAVMWFGSVSWLLGAGLAVWMAGLMLGRPGLALVRWLRRLEPAPVRRAARRRLAGVALGLGLAGGVLPWPDATLAEGLVVPADVARLRAGSDGFVDEVLVREGEAVEAGRPLLRLRAPELVAQRARRHGELAALEAERARALAAGDAAAAVAAAHAQQAAEAELARLDERIAALEVRAAVAGRVHFGGVPGALRADDLPGRHVTRGMTLGHLEGEGPAQVRVVVDEDEAARIVARRGPVAVRLAGEGAMTMAGEVVGRPSGGGEPLPGAALAERSGGPVATDPSDPQGLRPARPVLQLDVRLDRALPGAMGRRVQVRMAHPPAPLAVTVLRTLRQRMLRHFNPAA